MINVNLAIFVRGADKAVTDKHYAQNVNKTEIVDTLAFPPSFHNTYGLPVLLRSKVSTPDLENQF